MGPRKRAASKPETGIAKRHKDATANVHSALAGNGRFSMQAVNSWFRQYKGDFRIPYQSGCRMVLMLLSIETEPQEDVIGPAGVMQFCKDIEVAPEDVCSHCLLFSIGTPPLVTDSSASDHHVDLCLACRGQASRLLHAGRMDTSTPQTEVRS